MRTGAIAAGIDVEGNLANVLADAVDNAVIKKAADTFKADLQAFDAVLLKT
jgi:hypothetical protein